MPPRSRASKHNPSEDGGMEKKTEIGTRGSSESSSGEQHVLDSIMKDCLVSSPGRVGAGSDDSEADGEQRLKSAALQRGKHSRTRSWGGSSSNSAGNSGSVLADEEREELPKEYMGHDRTAGVRSFRQSFNAVDEQNRLLSKLIASFERLEQRVCVLEGQLSRPQSILSRSASQGSLPSAPSFFPADPHFHSAMMGIGYGPRSYVGPIFVPSNEQTVASASPQRPNLAVGRQQIKRGDLDGFCIGVFVKNPTPSNEEIEGLVQSIRLHFPTVTMKDLLSKVREWFRKRREYTSQRIFQVCDNVFAGVSLCGEEELQACLARVISDSSLVEHVLAVANLELEDASVAREYCTNKIRSYLDNRYRENLRLRRYQ